MAAKMEKDKMNRFSSVIYAVTTLNCVFMLVSIACLSWNVNIHREVSRIKLGLDPVISERTQKDDRVVRSVFEPGSQEDIEYRKKEEREPSMRDPRKGDPVGSLDNTENSLQQATCSECKRICTLIFYHQPPSSGTVNKKVEGESCGGPLFDQATVEKFVADVVEKRYGSSLQQFEKPRRNDRNSGCPSFPFQAGKCSENVEHECLDSSDCDKGKICCSDGCEKICVQPQPPRNDTATDATNNYFAADSETVCPTSPVVGQCPEKLEHECMDDSECSKGKKCCVEGCERICVVPTLVEKKENAGEKNRTLINLVQSYVKHYLGPLTSEYNSTLAEYQKRLREFDESVIGKLVGSQMTGYIEPLRANISWLRKQVDDQYVDNKTLHLLVGSYVDDVVKPLETELNRRFDDLPKPVSTEAIKEIVDDYAKRFYAAEKVTPGNTKPADNSTIAIGRIVKVYMEKYLGPLPDLEPTCPPIPPSGECPLVRDHECDNDAGCEKGKKCCSDGCDRFCATAIQPTVSPLRPVGEPIDNSTVQRLVKGYVDKYLGQLNIRNDTRPKFEQPFNNATIERIVSSYAKRFLEPLNPPVCPTSPSADVCPKDLDHECINDQGCANGLKCCFDACERRCLRPIQPTSPPNVPDGRPLGNGTIRQLVKNYVDQYLGPLPPYNTSGPPPLRAALGKMIDSSLTTYFGPMQPFNGTIQIPFSNLNNVSIGSIADSRMAKYLGSLPQPACPSFPPPEECPAQRLNDCDKDDDCPEEQKCCLDGCDRKCFDPVQPLFSFASAVGPAGTNSTIERTVQTFMGQYFGGDPGNFNSTVRGLVKGYTAEFLGGANFSGTAVGGAPVTRETVNQLVQEYGQQLFGGDVGNFNSNVRSLVRGYAAEFVGGDPGNFNSTVRGLVKGYTAKFLSGANFSGTAVGGAPVTRETVNQLVQEYGQQLFGGDVGSFNSTVRGLVRGYAAEFLGGANVSQPSVGVSPVTKETVTQLVNEYGQKHLEELSKGGCSGCSNASIQRLVQSNTRSLLGLGEGPIQFNRTVQKMVSGYLDSWAAGKPSGGLDEKAVRQLVESLVNVLEPECPPNNIDPANCPQERSHECSKDSECSKGEKCCLVVCDNSCVKAIAPTRPPVAGIDNATIFRLINKFLEEKGLFNITQRPGPPGRPGFNGTRGQPGTRGLNGSAGPPGPIGPEGPAGPKGEPGKDGTNLVGGGGTGPPGRDGRDGNPGKRGPRGRRGSRGPPGAKGEPGEKPKKKEKPNLFEGFVKPNITKRPNATVLLKDGDIFNMICDATGVPMPEIFWVKEGSQESKIGGKFSLYPARWQDAGRWTCIAKNVLGVQTAPMDLTVFTKPVFTVEPPTQFTAYQDRVSKFKCEATGHPEPKIEWKRSGDRPLPSDGRHVVEGTTLVLRNPRMSDSDIYVCHASNAGGTAVAGVDVTVSKYDPLEVVTAPPGRIVMKKIGLTLTANCSASGVPRPNITWYKDGVRVPSKERLVNGDIFSELYVEKFKPKDQGLYECRVSSALERMPASRYMHVYLPDCPDPGCPKDGQRSGDEFFSGSVVKFSCNPGCFLYGSAIRICGKDGRWSGTQPVCHNLGPVVAYECQHYKLLTKANRNKDYGRLMGSCDEKLATGWYRFAGGAGMQMLNSCTTRDHCDTRYPGWFWGRLPHYKEGCVSAYVCFGTAYEGCCLTKKKILVRNCGKFYVYKLGPVPNCPARYCGE